MEDMAFASAGLGLIAFFAGCLTALVAKKEGS